MAREDWGVLFDIDGTLVDSNYLHTLAWWRAFRAFGHTIPMFEIHLRVGMGADKFLEDLVGCYDEALSERYSAEFEPLRSEIEAFTDAAALLKEVKSMGATVVLATSAKKDQVDFLLEVVGAGDSVDHVTSSADVEATKPSPDIFETAMEMAGLSAGRCLVVGDTVWDFEAAKRLDVVGLGVLSGGNSEEALVAAGATEIYRNVSDLLENLKSSAIGKLAQQT